MDARQRASAPANELTCDELTSLFADIAREAPGTIIVLTGGEPLLHPQIEEITSVGADLGLRMVLGTNGVLLNESKIRALKGAGLSGVGVSLDSVYADQHDSFRGVPGAFARSVGAIELCRSHDLHTQVHFTMTKDNYDQAAQAVDLARRLGVSIVNFFFLVCVGRGESYLDLPPDLYESSLAEISRLQECFPKVMIQSRCTPHFKRILYQANPNSPFTRAQGYDGGGCLAGTHYCRIAPEGDVTPCPYLPLPAGNIREQPFWEIWTRSQR
jgi:MoaA/NifB/PqqE/SkfB family radical SAM enzyme